MRTISIGWEASEPAPRRPLVHRIIGTDEGTQAVCGASWSQGQVTTRIDVVTCATCAATLISEEIPETLLTPARKES